MTPSEARHLAVRGFVAVLTLVGGAFLAQGFGGGSAHGLIGDFTPLDVDPPHVLTTSPMDGATNVSVASNIIIRFSEAMNVSSVEGALRIALDAKNWTGANGTFLWSLNTSMNDTVAFNPFENWPLAGNVTVTLNASIATDVAGLYLDGDADNVSEGSPADDANWSFRVEARDTTPPSVAAVLPANGASGVPETTDIQLNFTEAMNRTSVETAFALASAMRTWTRMNGLFEWSAGLDRASYTPSANLALGTSYTIRLTSGSLDLNGNVLDGDGDAIQGGDFASGFVTRPEPDLTPPVVISTLPADGATRVSRTPTISITFDDAMDQDRTAGAISMARLNDTATPIALGPFEWSAADHTVSFPVSRMLAWDAPYRVSISEAARDDAGLPLSAPYAFTFRTLKWAGRVTGTVLEGTRPVAGATVALGSWTTQTNETGAFSFEGVEAGTYGISISKSGYETASLTRTLNESGTTEREGRSIDLGVIAVHRSDLLSPPEAVAVLAAVFAGLFVFGLLLRRRRRSPWHFDELAPEDAEIDR